MNLIILIYDYINIYQEYNIYFYLLRNNEYIIKTKMKKTKTNTSRKKCFL